MNTAEKNFSVTLISGPNRETLMDTFRMQYIPEGSRPFVTFVAEEEHHFMMSSAIALLQIKLIFRPMALQYEDGSGQSFNIEGYIDFDGTPYHNVYVKGYYSTQTRKGILYARDSQALFKSLVDCAFANRLHEISNQKK